MLVKIVLCLGEYLMKLGLYTVHDYIQWVIKEKYFYFHEEQGLMVILGGVLECQVFTVRNR